MKLHEIKGSKDEEARYDGMDGVGLGRLATWHLPGGPVGPASRWAATSVVEVGQTTYPINR